MDMSESRAELAADVRGLPAEERTSRLRDLFARIGRRQPDSRYAGMSDDQVVAAIKRTREEIWKEHVAGRR